MLCERCSKHGLAHPSDTECYVPEFKYEGICSERELYVLFWHSSRRVFMVTDAWQHVEAAKNLYGDRIDLTTYVPKARVEELEVARKAYASEFPSDDDGDPVGSIHENIRMLKAWVKRVEEKKDG